MAARPLLVRPSRRALLTLGGALVLVGLALLGWSLFTESDKEEVAERFAQAWAREDWEAMHSMLSPDTRADLEPEALADAYREAAATATATAVEPGDADLDDGGVAVPVTVSTRVFGEIQGEVLLRVGRRGVAWEPHMTFPELREGEELSRRVEVPGRAAILARDGTVLAEGDAAERTSELPIDASAAAGTIGPAPTEEAKDRLYERGFPRDAEVGFTGLEMIFEERVAGTPGGVLRAGEREIASSEPRPAQAVTTTIDPDLQVATATALTQFGGIAVLDAAGGEVRAMAGIAANPQPPGSTFKIVTTTAALESGAVTPSTEFPVETAAVLDGTELSNAHDAPCGGDFVNSFAESCNSVFAPLGVEVGAERLVATAERFGLNQPSPIPNVPPSTIPAAGEIESDLELGATAIGQGRLLVTPLRLASISQAIANDGKLVEPRLVPDEPPERLRVTSRRVANTIEDLMVGVVASGTGTSAAIDGVDVAGKTGTAELGPGITEHAWFTAFAPADDPELAIAVLIANGGAGGEVAAPVARTVLEAGL